MLTPSTAAWPLHNHPEVKLPGTGFPASLRALNSGNTRGKIHKRKISKQNVTEMRLNREQDREGGTEGAMGRKVEAGQWTVSPPSMWVTPETENQSTRSRPGMS